MREKLGDIQIQYFQSECTPNSLPKQQTTKTCLSDPSLFVCLLCFPTSPLLKKIMGVKRVNFIVRKDKLRDHKDKKKKKLSLTNTIILLI